MEAVRGRSSVRAAPCAAGAGNLDRPAQSGLSASSEPASARRTKRTPAGGDLELCTPNTRLWVIFETWRNQLLASAVRHKRPFIAPANGRCIAVAVIVQSRVGRRVLSLVKRCDQVVDRLRRRLELARWLLQCARHELVRPFVAGIPPGRLDDSSASMTPPSQV